LFHGTVTKVPGASSDAAKRGPIERIAQTMVLLVVLLLQNAYELLVVAERLMSPLKRSCYVAFENRFVASCADLRGQRHITIGATLCIRLLPRVFDGEADVWPRV
jgi:hypothetical protein